MIIIIFSFGIKFISSFLKQCDFQPQDLKYVDELYNNMTKVIPPFIFDKKFPHFKENLIKTINKNNKEGLRACKNMYNVLLLDDYFEYFIILSALGYLLGLFLHSFSAVKFKYFIDKKYISPYLIIIFIGLIGFVLNIILLFISSFIRCGDSSYSLNFCHATEYENKTFIINETIVENNTNITNFENSTNIENITNITNITINTYEDYKFITHHYFDSFLAYIEGFKDTFHPHNGTKYNITYSVKVRKPKDGILEIIFSLTILPLFGFFKTTFDLFIIKELGVFHLLFPEVIYQFAKDLIIIIYKQAKGISDKTQITQFIFIGITDFFALIGFSIYLELIQLKFCKFDYNIKENIIKRSMLEIEDANNDMRISDINDEENSDNENNDEDK